MPLQRHAYNVPHLPTYQVTALDLDDVASADVHGLHGEQLAVADDVHLQT